MEGELWKLLYQALMKSGKGKRGKKQQYGDDHVAMVYLWAVLWDRPVSWACNDRNWPEDKPLGGLPTPSTMSRRLSSEGVQQVLNYLEQYYRQRMGQSLFKCIDAMPLVVGNSTTDRQAGYGRAGNGKAKGYKFYAIMDSFGGVDAWRVCPMNVSEIKVARRLVRDLAGPGYLIGDGEYDNSSLYALASQQQWQLLSPKRRGKSLGHRRQRRERLRGIELQQHMFGQQLIHERAAIERFFGSWSSWSCGIKHPPAWVRTHRRVRRWVQAKLILRYARRVENKRLTA